jgi:hypothetical protein
VPLYNLQLSLSAVGNKTKFFPSQGIRDLCAKFVPKVDSNPLTKTPSIFDSKLTINYVIPVTFPEASVVIHLGMA